VIDPESSGVVLKFTPCAPSVTADETVLPDELMAAELVSDAGAGFAFDAVYSTPLVLMAKEAREVTFIL
jgi:hypothetical protein